MIVGPGGENIYPEDIETVLNSHVYIADSIVTEQEGRLVALVHFNRDEIEAMVDNWREEWETKKEAWEAKTEQLKKEIMDFVNAKVNRFSRISEVVEEKDDFAKTPTHKIKRFLYNRSKDNDKPQREQPARKITSAIKSKLLKSAGRVRWPYSARIINEIPAEAIIAITAGRSPAKTPCTMLKPRKR